MTDQTNCRLKGDARMMFELLEFHVRQQLLVERVDQMI
jgi:hypothetical protein